MTISRAKSTRLFTTPYSNTVVSATCFNHTTEFDNASVMTQTYEAGVSVNASAQSVSVFQSRSIFSRGVHIDGAPNILSSGYYVYQYQYWMGGEKTAKTAYNIGNAIHGDISNMSVIEEELNPSLIALTEESAEKHQLIIGSKDCKTLYAYRLISSTSFVSSGSSGVFSMTNFHAQESFGLQYHWVNGEKTEDVLKFGLPVYSVSNSNEIIASIAGFSNPSKFKQHTIAMALNTGKVFIGEVNEEAANIQFKELTVIQNEPQLELLSTQDGILIAHSPNHNMLYLWDLKTPGHQAGFPCAPLYNLSISADGTALVGLEHANHEPTNRVHYFALPRGIHHVITFDSRVTNFVISANHQVHGTRYTATNQSESASAADEFALAMLKPQTSISIQGALHTYLPALQIKPPTAAFARLFGTQPSARLQEEPDADIEKNRRRGAKKTSWLHH